jgi:MFS family permease
MLPDLVPTGDLLAAVSLSSAQFNLGRVIGPAAAGLVLLHHDYTLTFAINAASFLAVVVALCLVRLPTQVRSPGQERIRDRLVEGARTAWAEPGCRSAILLIGTVALLVSPFIALVPVMSSALGHGSGGTATLVTAQGVGAVLGSLALPGLAERYGRGRMVRLALVVLPLVLVVYGLAPTLWVSAVVFLLVGAAYISVLAGLNSVVQLRAPAVSRGRVLGLYMMALGVCYPIGAVVQGAIAGATGIRAVTVAGAVALLVVLALLRAARPGLMAALGAGPEHHEEPAGPEPTGTPVATEAPVPPVVPLIVPMDDVW